MEEDNWPAATAAGPITATTNGSVGAGGPERIFINSQSERGGSPVMVVMAVAAETKADTGATIAVARTIAITRTVAITRISRLRVVAPLDIATRVIASPISVADQVDVLSERAGYC
jgi:hypothetical protein